MSEKLTDEQIADFKHAFSIYDRDGDGFIATKDLCSLLRSVGYRPTDQEIMDLLYEFDSKGEGTLEFPLFLSLMARKMKEYEGEKDLREAFRAYDRERLGYISADLFRQILAALPGQDFTEEEIEDVVKEADMKGDGQINYDAFISMMVGKPKSQTVR